MSEHQWYLGIQRSAALRGRRRDRVRDTVASPARVLLGIDEAHRPPRLVVLLRTGEGPHLTQRLRLPTEYLDLVGNRRLVRIKGAGDPTAVTLGESRKARARELLRDRRVWRLYRAYRLANVETARTQVEALSRLLDRLGLSVSEAIYLGRYEPARLETLLYQWVEKRTKEGRLSSTLGNALVPLRALLDKENVPFYNWPRFRKRGAPSLATERIPTSQELGQICANLEPRWRAAALLMAQSGLRPGVLCKNAARNGVKALQLKHLPDLKLKPRPHFERIPFQINVPAELSKAGQAYLTFGGQEAAEALLAYLRGRTKPVLVNHWRVVRKHRERLTPESYVIAGTLAGKRRDYAGNLVAVLTLGDSLRRGIQKVQPEGVRWRPYVLRHYFATRLLSAEHHGMMFRDVREYMLGHNTGAAGRYILGKRLGEEVIDEMRSIYAKALPYLETPRTVPQAETGRRIKRRPSGPDPTRTLIDREKGRFPGPIDSEFVDRLSRGLRVTDDEHPRQQVVPIAEGRRLVKQGWQFVGKLGQGEIVVRSPQLRS